MSLEKTQLIEKNKAILRRYIQEVWNKGDVNLLDELMAPEHVCHGMRTDVFVTREKVKKAVIDIHKEYTDFQISVDDILGEGDTVSSRIQMSGIRNEDGRFYYLDELMVHRIKDGRIHGSWTIGSEWKEIPNVCSIDGIDIHYEVLGEGDTTLVFVGGWAASTFRTYWKYQIPFAGEYRIVLLDLAGMGMSGKSRENYSMELYGHDVKSVIEKLDSHNAILIGHSMGGPVILETERLIPERIIGLIPVDSLFHHSPAVSYIAHDEKSVCAEIERLEEDFVGVVSGIFKSFVSDKFAPKDVEFMKKLPYLLDKRSNISALAELLRWDMFKVLPEVSSPIKCIISGKSLPEEYRNKYNQMFDAVYLEGLGHFPIWESPYEFNNTLDHCIRDLLSEGRNKDVAL